MSGGHGSKQDRKTEEAIAALLSESTVEKAAAKCGVAYRTLKSWLAEPSFRAEYLKARSSLLEESIVLLIRSREHAVGCLLRNLKSDSPAVQVAAARALLDHSNKGVETLDLLERIEALERRRR